MSYKPQVDDYVIWKTDHVNVEGWVYFYDEKYITIETGIKPKPNCEYTKIERHKYIHTLYYVLERIRICSYEKE